MTTELTLTKVLVKRLSVAKERQTALFSETELTRLMLTAESAELKSSLKKVHFNNPGGE